MDIRYFVDKGYSFDDILKEVKKEYESESKRKKNEEDKKRAAEAEKLKRKTARAALMKAWRDYTLVVSKGISPAEVDRIMAGIEDNLVDFENTFEMVDKYLLGGVDLAREKKAKSDEEKLHDFLRNLEKMF